jgi:hypothetical protein
LATIFVDHWSPEQRYGWRRLVEGPWPLIWGAVALALGNFATLYLAGRPWCIASALALWGPKLLFYAGVDVADWLYWQGDRLASLQQGIFHVTTVMDFGIMAGALLAAALARKFRPEWRIQPLFFAWRDHWKIAAWIRRTDCLWLQYRRLLQRHRLR